MINSRNYLQDRSIFVGYACEINVYQEIKKTFELEIADELFKKDAIIKLLDDHKNGVRDNYRKVWAIYSFLKWYEVFFLEENK